MSKKRSRKAAAPAPRTAPKERPPVTRQDLARFDRDAKDLVLDAQERGATVRISNRGHAILYGPNGATASVPPHMKSNNRSDLNTRAGVARLFR